MAKYESILFDLDGTLLPMNLERFVKIYFNELGHFMTLCGFKEDKLTEAVWAGTQAMVKNAGSMLNDQCFWNTFSKAFGEESLSCTAEFIKFYSGEFNKAKAATWDNPNTGRAIKAARNVADRVILATNPLFPPNAVETRLSWIGLTMGDFDYVTTYDNSHYCKPNPRYYEELAEKLSFNTDSALMIGNDIEEDGVAHSAGFDVFITTDCVLGDKEKLCRFRHGTFEEMCEYLEMLEKY